MTMTTEKKPKTMALEKEIATYKRELPNLTGQDGKFALVYQDEMGGIFDTYDDALKTGYEKYGLEPFMVKRIESVEQVQFFYSRSFAMPHLTIQISPGGPIVELAIGVSAPHQQALQKAGQPIPPSVRVRGLVDTGASGTCIDPDVLTKLKLTPRGQVLMHTPSTAGTPQPCDQYDVSIVLMHPKLSLTIYALPVISSAKLASQGFQVLIGRDVLRRCLFVYDGQTSLFTLAF
ncbi:MAG: retroviral-like aspartic protease [Planctomycetes bacterium]|nr:retroviral-like aspartic protease [Planctomycetota bacterium]